jgi:hypothetical protein
MNLKGVQPFHPSGRPVHRQERKALPVRRIPRADYLTPRLNHWGQVMAIGFTVRSQDDGASPWCGRVPHP